MKFHHLARHNQLVAAAAVAAAAAANQHQSARGISPSKLLQQATSHHQQAMQQLQQTTNNNNNSDDEDDEFNSAYYDEQQSTTTNSNNNNNNQQQDSNFLMDKNKKLFPQKLWELIHNPSIQHCLRWSQDGQRVYLNRNEFEAYYLKTPNNQFHTQKAISFVRQMNMYGFRKVDDCYYENDNFRRDRQHLLRNMIRRHPNKGLFVGLDHHQLAAAAAAQQALQVNQQLQQLENQHKHRQEQALRLNNYLNNHHQSFNNAAAGVHPNHLAAHLNHHHHHHHQSSPFDHMSSHLAQVAANHLSQQQHHLNQQQQQHHHHIGSNTTTTATNLTSTIGNNSNQSNNQTSSSTLSVHHQPKKSRLLNNFYASTTTINGTNGNKINNGTNLSNQGNGVVNENNLASVVTSMHNQDSMHSTSSVDTQRSQCSSVVNSGSAGSPQPTSPTNLNLSIHHNNRSSLNSSSNGLNNNNHRNSHQQMLSSSTTNDHSAFRAAVLAAAAAAQQHQNGGSISKFCPTSGINSNHHQQCQQHTATDLSSNQNQSQQQSIANRQAALHQTLVRSLLQLKQHPQDLLASALQQHNPRSLIESLASLSSAGTASSIVDPTSNSPTERTATPPSSPPSPSQHDQLIDEDDDGIDVTSSDVNNKSSTQRHLQSFNKQLLDSKNNIINNNNNNNNNNIVALDLAKSSINSTENMNNLKRRIDELYPIDIRGGRQIPGEDDTEIESNDEDDDDVSPLDGEKKVRRFLNNQMNAHCGIKRELPDNDDDADNDNDDGSGEVDEDNHVDEKQMKTCLKSKEKRIKLADINNLINIDDISSISRSLILGICEKRGDQLEISAINEAARYAECFLDLLLENANSISKNGSDIDCQKGGNEEKFSDKVTESKKVETIEEKSGDMLENTTDNDHDDNGKVQTINNENNNNNKSNSNEVVDSSTLFLALKLIPSKLIDAIEDFKLQKNEHPEKKQQVVE